MAASSSSSQPDEVLPLIPCSRCGDKVVTLVSRAGEPFHKCVRKNLRTHPVSFSIDPTASASSWTAARWISRQLMRASSRTHSKRARPASRGNPSSSCTPAAAHAAGEPSQRRTALLLR
nr:uncharacterized protein LOC120964289 [Aegilops tauschii subsp. strangulata]